MRSAFACPQRGQVMTDSSVIEATAVYSTGCFSRDDLAPLRRFRFDELAENSGVLATISPLCVSNFSFMSGLREDLGERRVQPFY